ncbi:MAG: Gfo/Idh/MocA family oxidoreductase [Opitutae bacterium]|nr:Gfo/Idh/MocA family oxidoreductase [Opitutae bacterium]
MASYLRAADSAPAIVPAKVLGKNAPSKVIQIAQIGCGRIGRESEIPGIVKQSHLARIVAACDVDAQRLSLGKQLIEQLYAKQSLSMSVKAYADYREILRDPSIDAVAISVPDHWHGQMAIEAALAGKDIYLQKPAAITIREGRQMADAVKQAGRILQLGSQQRSSENFRIGCELVRNGRIGRLKEVRIGLPTDPLGGVVPDMPVPAGLDYDAWLGATPMVPYTEKRVHPQKGFGRPGWMCLEAYCAGMITNWGAHHVDIAHWGMGAELTGPGEVIAQATYPKSGLWDVASTFHVEMKYPNGVTMIIDTMSDTNGIPNGVKFIGEEGWIFVSRGSAKATASDPTSGQPAGKPLAASNAKILEPLSGSNVIRLHASKNQHLDWLESIQTRQDPVASAEVGHRSCSACLVAQIAMKRGSKLTWDAKAERFVGDDAANAMLTRPQRAPYGTDAALKKATAKA